MEIKKILISKKRLKEIVDGAKWLHAHQDELDDYVNGWFDNMHEGQQETLNETN